MKAPARILSFLLVMLGTCVLVIFLAYAMLPSHNTTQTHFDALIVLGYPALGDGSPSPEQRERVLEGVREYKAGVAPRIIFTGAAAHNAFTESRVMATLARSQGVPPASVIEESQAQNTIQNIYYSAQILRGHGWTSAEIISSSYHLPRAGLIINAINLAHPNLSFNWRTRSAPWPREYSVARELALYSGEAWHCWLLRFEGLPGSQFLPRPAGP